MHFSQRIIYHLHEGSAFFSEDRMRFYQRINVHFPEDRLLYHLGEVVYYPLGKMHSILWEKKHIYPMVSGTLSSGKWHIILWEKKLIPSGNWTSGNWNTTYMYPVEKKTLTFFFLN